VLAFTYANAYIRFMRTTSYSEFRKNLASNLDRVNDDCEPVLITRDRGKPAAVLMSLAEYASFEETMYLLRSRKNAQDLRESIAEMETTGGTERKLIE
jgi:antitoxin YefM